MTLILITRCRNGDPQSSKLITVALLPDNFQSETTGPQGYYFDLHSKHLFSPLISFVVMRLHVYNPRGTINEVEYLQKF